jgi:hypothetical protein
MAKIDKLKFHIVGEIEFLKMLEAVLNSMLSSNESTELLDMIYARHRELNKMILK